MHLGIPLPHTILKILIQEKLFDIIHSLEGFKPEAFLSLAFVMLIIVELLLFKFSKPDSARKWLFGISLGIFIISFAQIIQQFQHTNDGFLFHQMLFLDAKSIFFKGIVCISSILLLLHSWINKKEVAGEFFAIIIAFTLGLYLMTMSVNLLIIYLSIEIVSIGSYILTAFRKNKKGAEAGIKYIIFGATSSAIMLYGMSLLYGITGTLSIVSPDFSRGLSQVNDIAATVPIVLTLCGFLFKLSATPFHVWTPDVYEGTSNPIVAFFSVAPKAAVFLLSIRFLSAVPIQLESYLAIISLATITIGNFSAIWQQNAKRMLAYSTIAHSGFMMIGLVVLTELNIKSICFYLVANLFTNFATFFLLDVIDKNDNFSIKNFAGLGLKKPFYGILLVIVMISLTGLPPTAGFFAKLNIFSALWQSYQSSYSPLLLWLFVIGLINTAVSLFYYLKIPYMMFFKKSEENGSELTISVAQKVFAGVLVIPVLFLFFKADWLMELISML